MDLHPHKRQPHFKTFKQYDRLGETGSVRTNHNNAGRPKTVSMDKEDEVLVRVTENPELSTRRISSCTGITKSSVCRVLRTRNLYHYHFTPGQNQLPQEYSFVNFFENVQILTRTFTVNLYLLMRLDLLEEVYSIAEIAINMIRKTHVNFKNIIKFSAIIFWDHANYLLNLILKIIQHLNR